MTPDEPERDDLALWKNAALGFQAVLKQERAERQTLLAAIGHLQSERDSARAALGKVVEAVNKVAAKLDDEADNISPTAGVHPAPWMRKQAKKLRTALQASSG